MEEKEIWKPVKGLNGEYEVSNMARIRTVEHVVVAKDGRTMKILPRIKKQVLDHHGYLYVKVKKDGKQHSLRVHRAIMEAFVENPENKPFIDHINTIKTDNRIENLKWVTAHENTQNPITLQRIKDACTEENIKKQIQTKKNNGTWQGKSVYQYDMNGVFVAKYETISDAAKATRIHVENISNAIDVESKSAGGFLWRSIFEDNVKYTQNLLRGKTPIAMIDENGEEIKRWDTLKSLTNELKLNRHGLSYSLRYKDGRYKGAFFKYIQKE